MVHEKPCLALRENHALFGIAESFHQAAPAGFRMQGYPLGVVPPLADPPVKTPAAEVDVPGELFQSTV